MIATVLPCFSDRHGRFDQAFVEATVDDVPFQHTDRHGIAVDPQYAGPFAGRGTEPTGELGEIIRGVQGFERIFPAPAVDEIVPLRNQVHDRTTGIALTKGHTAIHATGALDLELVLGDRLVHFLPIEHTQLDRFPLRSLTRVFQKALWITHRLIVFRRSYLVVQTFQSRTRFTNTASRFTVT
jgi:hypothetical protein